MRGWSFPLGRWFGVDLRIHTFFLLLLGFCLLSTGVDGVAAWRGIMLWLLLLLAVFVREVARLITAAYHDLHLRSILLLPIGGLFSYATPESAERAAEDDGGGNHQQDVVEQQEGFAREQFEARIGNQQRRAPRIECQCSADHQHQEYQNEDAARRREYRLDTRRKGK